MATTHTRWTSGVLVASSLKFSGQNQYLMHTSQPKPLFLVFHLSPGPCPSTAGCSPPSVPSIVFCLLLSCSRGFPPSLLCCAAIFYLVLPLISSFSLVATLCSIWSIYYPSFMLYAQPISIFVSTDIRG